MAYADDNIFAKILRDEVPSFRVYEDEQTLAFTYPPSLGDSDRASCAAFKSPKSNPADRRTSSAFAAET